MTYNQAVIRQLIQNALTNEDFADLVQDHFPRVFQQFTNGQIKAQQIRILLEYVDRHREIEQLLSLIQEINPKRYEEYAAQIGGSPNPLNEIYQKFSSGQNLSDQISLLIEYVVKYRETDKLLDLIKNKNPKAYQEFVQEQKSKELAMLVNENCEEEEKGNVSSSNRLKDKSKTVSQELEKSDPRSQQFNNYIHHIDFQEAKEIFHKILNQHERQPSIPLLLMHQSKSKKGDIYLQYIKDRLTELTIKFQGYSIAPSLDRASDEDRLLNRIAQRLGISEREHQTIDKILKKIVDSIIDGKIIFFHLSHWDELTSPSQALLWLIQEFWQPLLNQVSEICQTQKYCNVKIILIIDSPGFLDEDCLNLDCICCYNNFDINGVNPDQVIEIPLRDWSQDEINRWLVRYTTIQDREERERRASLIYQRNSNGYPEIIYNELWEIWRDYH